LDGYANLIEAASVMGHGGNILSAVIAQAEQGLVKPQEGIKLVRAGLKALKHDTSQGSQILHALWSRIDQSLCAPLQALPGDERAAASVADLCGVSLGALEPTDVVAFVPVMLDKLAASLSTTTWPGPLGTLTQLLATLTSQDPNTIPPQVWAAVGVVVDKVVGLAARVLTEVKERGYSLETERYENLFGLLKQVTQCHYLNRKGRDALWLSSGWELVLLALETPIEVKILTHSTFR